VPIKDAGRVKVMAVGVCDQLPIGKKELFTAIFAIFSINIPESTTLVADPESATADEIPLMRDF